MRDGEEFVTQRETRKMAQDSISNREWIESHYGPIRSESKVLVIASVPVMGGVAIGIGESEEAALAALRNDLHAPAQAPGSPRT